MILQLRTWLMDDFAYCKPEIWTTRFPNVMQLPFILRISRHRSLIYFDLMFCCRSCSAFSQLPSTCKGVAKAKAKSIPPWMKLSQLFAPRRSARSIAIRAWHAPWAWPQTPTVLPLILGWSHVERTPIVLVKLARKSSRVHDSHPETCRRSSRVHEPRSARVCLRRSRSGRSEAANCFGTGDIPSKRTVPKMGNSTCACLWTRIWLQPAKLTDGEARWTSSCSSCMCVCPWWASLSLRALTRASVQAFQYYFVLQSSHKALSSTTLHYKACTKYFPTLLCTTKLAQCTFQYYFVLQSWHKVLPNTESRYKACTKYFPVFPSTTLYYVLQSLHKVFPSTTLYYKACTKYFLVLCTTNLKRPSSTTVHYKARRKAFPVLLCIEFSTHYAFTHRKLLHTASFYTDKLLHTKSFYTQQAFTQTSFTQICFYTQQAFTHRKPLHSWSFYTETFYLHREAVLYVMATEIAASKPDLGAKATKRFWATF